MDYLIVAVVGIAFGALGMWLKDTGEVVKVKSEAVNLALHVRALEAQGKKDYAALKSKVDEFLKVI